jgi:hypothetical protein
MERRGKPWNGLEWPWMAWNAEARMARNGKEWQGMGRPAMVVVVVVVMAMAMGRADAGAVADACRRGVGAEMACLEGEW